MKPHKICARCWSTRLPIDEHHWAGRAGRLKNNPLLKIPLCRTCHTWAHEHMNAAREAGFLCPKGCWNDEKRALQAQAARGILKI